MLAEVPTRWLLIRGLGRQSAHWYEFTEQLAERLGARAEAVDLPGTGHRRGECAPLSVRALARDLAGRLERGPADVWGVLGISLGAMVALALGSLCPLSVTRLVLLNPSSRLSSPRQRLLPAARREFFRAALAPHALSRERIITRLSTNAPLELVECWARRAAELERRSPLARRTFAAQLIAAARFRPPRVLQPTAILSGAGDRVVSPECSRALARLLGAHLAVHPTAGHDLPLEAPDWVLDEIAVWLRQSRETRVE